MCKKELLLLDFEGILKYFRVSLPKKCRNEENAQQLLKIACGIKVKKLKKYETDFLTLKGINYVIFTYVSFLIANNVTVILNIDIYFCLIVFLINLQVKIDIA